MKKFYPPESACPIHHTRRSALLQLLGMGGAIILPLRTAQANSSAVWVNGQRVHSKPVIKPGDTVTTGENSELAFVVGQDAYLMRPKSYLTLQSEGSFVRALRLFTGGLLAVFAKSNKRIETPLVTAGIRGTGVYVQTEREKSYFCTCYGAVELETKDKNAQYLLQADHHNARWIQPNNKGQLRIAEAPMIDHQDAELLQLEQSVGRRPPFLR